MNELFLKCLEAARLIVQAEKAAWPGCEGAVAVDIGGGTSESDSKFSRTGTSNSYQQYNNLPQYLTSKINDNVLAGGNDSSLTSRQNTLFQQLMDRTSSSLPGAGVLDANMAISPTSFTGGSALESIAARDPFSSQFETATQAAYEQRASDAMAQAATGPDAVRGGNARTGIAQGVMADRLAQGRGQEVRNAQMQDAGLVGMAGQLFNNIEASRRGIQLGAQGQKGGQTLQQDSNALGAARAQDNRKVSNLGALQIASDLLGTKFGQQADDLAGHGSQTNSSFQWSVPLSNIL